MHVYSPRVRVDVLGDKLWIYAKMSYHFDHWLQVSKISLPSDFINIFHDFIHVYSPRAGPWGQNFGVNRKAI